MKLYPLVALMLMSIITIAQTKKNFETDGKYLSVELLKDGVFRFQYGMGKAPAGTIPATDMVEKSSFILPQKMNWVGNSLQTSQTRISINKDLSIEVIDKINGNEKLTTIKPIFQNDSLHGIMGSITPNTAYYGLGEQFKENNSSLNYRGKIKEGDEYGNRMLGFNGGGGPNVQMPVIYALESGTFKNYAVFVDNTYKQKFDLTNNENWYDIVRDKTLNFYLITGKNIKELHSKYVNLIGKPLMIPKKMFGLWISEFGFDNWAEVDDKIRTLRENKFPVDGAVFDLEWFGAEQFKERNDTMPLFKRVYMGKLAWDEKNFPNPTAKLAAWEKDGIGTMVIQEPFVAKHLKEWDEYVNNNVLVKDSTGTDSYIFRNHMWFGDSTGGGMFDYTDPKAGDYIFKNKILKLINMGLVGNWLDLGEPEHFQPWSKYYRGSHKDVNNMYSFYWQKSIYDGYNKYGVQKRPFMMCRTGAPGMQRFGATLWNGDPMLRAGNLMATGANWGNLSLAGTFYYSSCAGGFYHRPDPFIDTASFYTRWYAYSCLFDQPIWPHNFNPHNLPDEAAPDRIGDKVSNLFATRQRYELLPYYYSLAYRAYIKGDPIYAPMIDHNQNDDAIKDVGSQMMIGDYLLGGIPQTYNAMDAKIYLPKGTWYNWHTKKKITSNGEWLKVPYYSTGMFQIPVFAKEGAIIPKMYIDDKTQNALGRRSDGSTNNDLIVSIIPSSATTSFNVYEDDGVTIDYTKGIHSITTITQNTSPTGVSVKIAPSVGPYKPFAERDYVIELISDRNFKTVKYNGAVLKEFTNVDDFKNATSGFIRQEGVVKCKTGKKPVTGTKEFVFGL